MQKKHIYNNLYFQVIVAIILGILLGYFLPGTTETINGVEEHIPGFAEKMEPFSTGFIRLIKMVIAPIIFCTVVSGIAGMQNAKSVGKFGGFAILYFEIVSTFALLIGLVIVNIAKPGTGMDIDISRLDTSGVAQYMDKHQSFVDFLMNIIPTTVVNAFAEGNILQVLFFAILFGFALNRLGEKGQSLLNFINQFAHVMFNIVNVIMRLAPIGAFGAMAFTIGRYGIDTLLQLAELMACFYATCLIFIIFVLGSIARLYCNINIFRLIRLIGAELLIVLGTSSSESVLPRMLKKMELVGCPKSIVGLVIPTGYSFNLDGTSIYLTMSAIFIAQALNINLSLDQELWLLLILLLSSKGAAAVTSGGLIVLTATLAAVGTIPVEGVALILGIDRFMSEARALTNLIGNALATVVVSKFSGKLDANKLDDALKNPTLIDKAM